MGRERHRDTSARPSLIEELEPRILLSADLPVAPGEAPVHAETGAAGVVVDEIHDAGVDPGVAASDHETANDPRREIVFVDTGIGDPDTLLADLANGSNDARSIEVFVLDAEHDGIAQISEVLSRYAFDVDAVHVLSHGTETGVQLGSTWLGQQSLTANADAIAGWRAALSQDADLLVYGCNLAGSEKGLALVDDLANLTGADVAASTDLTGSAALGGDWELEHRRGAIETTIVVSTKAQQSWEHSLDPVAVAGSSGTDVNVSSVTVSHTTAAGTDRLILVGVAYEPNGGETVSSVTYDGANLSFVGADTHAAGTLRVEVWSMVAPNEGTADVVVTLSAQANGVAVGAVTFTGVDQGNPLGAFVSTEGESTTASVDVASAANELVFGFTGVRMGLDATPGAGQTEWFDAAIGNAQGAATSEAGAATVTTSWNLDVNDKWIASGVSIRPSADFQEGVSGYTGAVDTRVTEDNAGANQGGDPTLRVDMSAGADDQGLIRFDNLFGSGAGEIPWGSTITSATLEFDVTDASVGGATIALHRMTIPWTDSASWSSMGGGVQVDGSEARAVADSILTTPAALGRVAFTGLEAALQSWSDGAANHGWVIVNDSSNGWVAATSDHGTPALRPSLSVSYAPPPPRGTAIWSQNGTTTPQTNDFDGTSFGTESNAADVGGPWTTIVGAEAPTRNEKLVAGVDAGGNLSGQLWDGTSWTALSFNDFASVTDPDQQGLAVAYESQTGDAMLVYNNGTGGATPLSYRTWDGNAWSAAQTITVPAGAEGEAYHMKLAADPGSDEMVLIVGAQNAAIDYALVWDGTSWGNGILLDSTTGADRFEVAVAYESQSGNALVVYDDSGGTNLVGYRTWNGTTWSAASSVAAPGGIGGTSDNNWDILASDPTSDRIVMGVSAGANETWLAIWDGSTWVDKIAAGSSNPGPLDRVVDVAFESQSGEAIAVYADSGTDNVRYRTWRDGSGWSAELTGPDPGARPRVVSLSADPVTNQVMLAVQDTQSDLNFFRWDGETWGAGSEQETNTGGTDNLPFLFLWNRDSTPPIGSSLWITTETDVSASSGAPGLESWSGGNVLGFGGHDSSYEPGTTSGTFTRAFDLDDFVQDGDSRLDAIHYVSTNMNVGSNSIPLQVGDVLLSSVFPETLVNSDTSTVSIQSHEVFVYRPDDLTDYTAGGTFIELINGSDLGSVEIEGITLVESTTTVGSGGGAITLDPGDFLLTDRNDTGKIFRFQPGVLGGAATNTGTVSVLVDANGLGLNQAIHGVELVETTTTLGDRTLTSGQLLISTFADDTVSGTAVRREDIVLLDVTTAGAAPVATAEVLLEGADVGLDSWQESPWAVALVPGASPTNAAPTLTPATPDFTAISEDETINGGDLVSAILSGTVSDGDGDDVGLAVTGLSSGGGTWQYRLGAGAWTDVGAVATNNALLLRHTDSLRFLPDTLNGETPDPTVTYRAWDQSSGAFGTKVDTTTNGGATPYSSATDTASISVSSVNDAPTLVGVSPSLPGIDEDATANGGALVSTLLGGVGDVDNGAAGGLAITSLTEVNGTWQYRLGAGAWTDVGAVSATSALLLTSTDSVRFLPDGDNGGSPSFDFRAWDQTSGVAGTKVNPGAGGGTTAFSTGSDTASIVVSSVNDAPTLVGVSPSLPGIDEDATANGGALVSTLLGGVGDVDNGAASGLAITSLTEVNGTWQYRLGAGAWTDVGAVSATSALLLTSTDSVRFLPDGDNGGSPSFDFRAWDQTSGVAGTKVIPGAGGGTTAFSTGSDTASIVVSSVNDAPTLVGVSPSLPGIDEDATGNGGALVSTLLGGVGDVDTGAASGLAITSLTEVNGTWQYRLGAGAWTDVGAVSATSALLLNSTDSVRFLPDGDNGGSPSFDFRAWDQTSGVAGTKLNPGAGGGTTAFSTGSDTASITVSAVNDAPTLVGVSPSLPGIDEDATGNGGALVSTLLGGVGDVDTGAASGLAITSLTEVNGTWQYRLGAGAWTDVGAVSATSALLLTSTDSVRFLPDGTNGGSSSFDFRAWDQTSGVAGTKLDPGIGGGSSAFSSTGDTASIVVSSLNDAPLLDGSGDLRLTDVNEDETNPTGNSIAAILASDAGNPITDVDSGAVEGITVTAVDDTNGTWQYRIGAGAWTAVGTVSTSSALLLGESDALRFVPDPAYSGTAGTVGFRAWDQTSGTAGTKVDPGAGGGTTAFSTTSETATLDVLPVNDAPVLVPISPTLGTISEDDTGNGGQSVASIVGASISDVDSGAVEGIAITSVTATNGTWQYRIGAGAWTDVAPVTGSSALLLASTDLVRFLPDGQNAGSGNFSYRAWDQTSGSAGAKVDPGVGGGATAFSTASDTASITTTAANDAPVLVGVAPTLPGISEDDTINGGALVSTLLGGVSDVDTGAASGIAITALSEVNGTWQYRLGAGAWTDVGAVSPTSALLLTSTDSVRFLPDGDNGGSPSFDFRAWDQTSGVAGAKLDPGIGGGTTAFSTGSDTASIVVSSVNDAPTLVAASPSLPGISEDDTSNGGVLVSTLLGGVSDVDSGAAGGLAITSLTEVNGSWQYRIGAGPWTAVAPVGATSALLLATTDSVRFLPNGLNGGSSSFGFRAWDQTSGIAGTRVDPGIGGGTSAFSTGGDSASIVVSDANDPPSLDVNQIVLAEGDIVVLSAAELAASDPEDPPGSLIFTVSGVTGGFFHNSASGLTVTSFTQAEVTAGDISFVHDGGEAAPSYDVTVSDGFLVDGPTAAVVTFSNVNDAPVNLLPTLPQTVVNGSADEATSVTAADLDGDGDVDLVSTSWGDDQVVWYQNDGVGGFTPITIATGVDGARHVTTADVDGDGDLDVVSAAFGSNRITWYENDGAATPGFTPRLVSAVAVGAWFVEAADVDGDGDMDLLSASIWDDKIAWYENDGAPVPGFTERLVSTSPDGARAVVAGDLDGDGDIDLATASFGDDKIAWFENDGSATPGFTEHVVCTSALGAMSLVLDDIDGDGDLDMASASWGDGKIAWYENDGAASPVFAERVVSTQAAGARDVYAADLDGDGDIDLLSAAFVDDEFSWYENDGAATPGFTERLVSQGGDGPRSVVAADVDGDGDLDVVGASLNDDEIAFFENPDGELSPQSTLEETALEFSVVNGNRISISDSDIAGNDLRVRLEATNGTVSLNGLFGLTLISGLGTNDVVVEFSGSLADVNTALDGMTFLPDPDFVGVANLRVISDDQGANGSGGPLSDDDSVNIDVLPVNDAPVLTAVAPTLPGVSEDDTGHPGVLVSTLLGGVSDVDSGAVGGIAITALGEVNGTWQYRLGAGAWADVGAVSATSALLLAETDSVRFLPDGNNGGSSSFDFRAWDQTAGVAGSTANPGAGGGSTAYSTASDTASISVADVNDAPLLAAVGPSFSGISEDDVANPGETVATLVGGSISDVDTIAVEGIAVTGLVSGNGTWQYRVGAGAWIDVGAVSDANALVLQDTDRLRFVPDAMNGTNASISYRAWDQTSGTTGSKVNATANGGITAFSSATDTATIAVGSVNDSPAMADQTFPVDENSANGSVVGNSVASDVDLPADTLTWTLLSGNTGGAFLVDPGTGQIRVADSTALDFETNPVFNLVVEVRDPGGLMDTATITVILNDVPESVLIPDPPPPPPPPEADEPPAPEDEADEPPAEDPVDTGPPDDGGDAAVTTPLPPVSAPVPTPQRPPVFDFISEALRSNRSTGDLLVVPEIPSESAAMLDDPLVLDAAMWEALDQLARDFDQSSAEAEASTRLVIGAAEGASVAIMAGFLSWFLRGGTLLTSLLTTMPLWSRLDPVPVLDTDDEERARLADDGEDDHDAAESRARDLLGEDRAPGS